MNHVLYHAALTRRDDLLREAADRRLAKQAALAAEAPPDIVVRRAPAKRRLAWLRRSLIQNR